MLNSDWWNQLWHGSVTWQISVASIHPSVRPSTPPLSQLTLALADPSPCRHPPLPSQIHPSPPSFPSGKIAVLYSSLLPLRQDRRALLLPPSPPARSHIHRSILNRNPSPDARSNPPPSLLAPAPCSPPLPDQSNHLPPPPSPRFPAPPRPPPGDLPSPTGMGPDPPGPSIPSSSTGTTTSWPRRFRQRRLISFLGHHNFNRTMDV